MIYPYKDVSPKIDAAAFIAPTAVVIGDVTIGEFSSIWFNSVVRADINAITIGDNSNIQDGCMLHVTNNHPLIIADRVTAGHGAILHGCHIKSDCLVAMGAVVLDGAVVGEHSVIAAGAVVAPGTQIPPGSLVMGVPGRVVRQVTDLDRQKIERGWRNYVGYSTTYRHANLSLPQ